MANTELSTRHWLRCVWLCMVVAVMDIFLAVLVIEACIAFRATRSGGLGLVVNAQFRRRVVLVLMALLSLAMFLNP